MVRTPRRLGRVVTFQARPEAYNALVCCQTRGSIRSNLQSSASSCASSARNELGVRVFTDFPCVGTVRYRQHVCPDPNKKWVKRPTFLEHFCDFVKGFILLHQQTPIQGHTQERAEKTPNRGKGISIKLPSYRSREKC